MGKDKGHLVVTNDPNDDVAIRVEHVSKSFRLPHNKQNSIKGSLINLVSRGDRTYETQEVLKNISFEIKKGEFFGIVGRNGSGKSTLLKMLAGIYTPSKGKIIINGSLTPFIELGVGFNPELTGRENVYLNGALLGFNDKEVDSMYEDIVAFAELERFMDQKLKNYSSGMQVRLAFSIAIRAQSGILLLDEVLAVGDEAFQRKCYDYFEELKRNKRTVILVTHDMTAVERFCTRAMFVQDGSIEKVGSPHGVASAYSISNNERYEPVFSPSQAGTVQQAAGDFGVACEITNEAGSATQKFFAGEIVRAKVSWENPQVKNIGVALICTNGQYVYGTNTIIDRVKIKQKTISYKLTLNLAEGNYYFMIGFFGDSDKDKLYVLENGPVVAVYRNKNEKRWEGITKLASSWGI